MELSKRERMIEEDNELIHDILTRNYYNEFKKEDSSKEIELIINRLNIESKCYGCFNNTEKLMYPHIDFSENDYVTIHNNLLTFFKFYIKNGWKCPIHLNGIDWTNTDASEALLISLYNIFKDESQKKGLHKIIIDADFSKIIDNDLWYKWLVHYEKFKKVGITLFFNIHANGLYCDDNGLDEIFYNKLIESLRHHAFTKDSFKIITYVRPDNIDNWIKNYQWWIDNLGDLALTNIEIRQEKTENWTYEAIEKYIYFLQYQINFFSNKLNENEFLKLVFDKNKDITFHTISLRENEYLNNKKNNNNCGFFKNLSIDMTTMNIVPCPKVNYEDFACAQYVIENGEIAGIKAKNISIIIFNTHLKQICMPHCERCNYVELCSGHCLGESYNKCFDMVVPIREFCDLSIASNNYLIYFYNQMGIIEEKNMKSLKCNDLYIKLILHIKEILEVANING